jgi:cytochrome c-type biogenesis protein CcmH/NrfF
MTWALWLAVPVAVTVLAAVFTWLRGRPRRTPGTRDTMRAHDDYLDALTQTARSKDRGPYSGPPD